MRLSRSNAPAQIMIPLDIPDVDVKETQLCDGKLFITVESQKETVECGICDQQILCNYGKGQRIELRHLSVLGQETYVVIYPKRGQCPTCATQPTTTQRLSWYEQRSPHTLRYDNHLMKQLIGSTVEDVSMKEAVGYDAVLGALKRRVPVEVNWEQITDLGTIGIDEISMRKGHKGYKAIITARDEKGEKTILAVLDDRKKTQFSTF